MGATIKIAILAQAAKAKAEMESLGDSAEKSGGRVKNALGNLAGAAKAGAIGAGVAIGGLLVGGIGQALEQGQLTAKLGAQLGLTKDEAAKVGKLSGQVYADGFGTDVAQVNEAIKGVYQNIGEGNAQWTKEITSQVLSVANTFDQDLGGTTAAVGQLLRTGLAKDATEALDIITVGFQSGADKAGDLLDTFNEYGTQFRKLGIDGKTATGILSQGLQAGARDADVVADALKEFSIRAVDGSKATSEGFKGLGLDAKQMASDIAAGGPRANAALDATLERLRGVKDPVERAQLAVKLFGTQAEDLGDALYAIDPSSAVQALGDVEGAAKRVGDAMGESAGAKIEKFKRTLTQGFVEGLGAVIGWFESLGQKAGPVWDTLSAKAQPFVDIIAQKLMPKIQELWSVVQSQVIPALEGWAQAIAPIYAWIAEKLFPIVVTVFGAIVDIIRGALQIITGIIKVATGVLTGDWSKAWDGIKSILSGAWTIIKAVVQAAWAVVKGLFSAGVSGIVTIAATIGSRIMSAVSALGGLLLGWANAAWQKARSAFTTGVSNAVSTARELPGKVKSGLGNLASFLYSAGQDMIRGLINGIKAMAGQAVSAARGVVSDAVTGAKRLLGIASPSKVFTEIGQQTGAGFVLGLEGQRRAAQQAAQQLLDVPALAPSGRSAIDAGRAAGGSAQAPVVLRFEASGDPLMDAIFEALRKRVRVSGGNVQTVLGR